MEINNISNNSQISTTNQTNNSQNVQVENVVASTQEPVDEVKITNKKSQVYKPNSKEVRKLLEEANNKTESFKKLVQSLLTKQAGKNAIANGQNKDAEYNKLMKGILSGENVMVEIDEETRLKAQQDVAEDGYYGVKQTSERLLDFAIAVSGGDLEKMAKMREVVEEGFKQAEEIWGGKLPQISQDTYDATMKGFDEWEKTAAASGA